MQYLDYQDTSVQGKEKKQKMYIQPRQEHLQCSYTSQILQIQTLTTENYSWIIALHKQK